MLFNDHSRYKDLHAFLSPSTYHWINYDDQKLRARFWAANGAKRGTELHAYAQNAIKLGIKQRGDGSTLSLYINDAINFRMTPEQTLYFSDNCFGHCDAISFRQSRGRQILRIHDLKTGVIQTKMTQLEVYAALFCLEYDYKPFEIEIELRIYQNDEVRIHVPDPDWITHIMDRIVTFDKQITLMRMEAE